MKFITSLITVADISRSRQLYENILGQKVIADFGEFNVSYEGGLSFYKRSLYQNLIGDERIILNKSNNFELYFETDNLIEIKNEISKNGFEFVHEIREEPWKQQVFRFYDYDNNIVVIAEIMENVSRRLFKENHTVDEISKMTGLPPEEILQHINEYRP
jgi:hypothetical protein